MVLAAGLFMASTLNSAELVEMRNGERYLGKILSMSTNAVVLESQTAGTLSLSRAQVASIQFDTPKSAPLIAATNGSGAQASLNHAPTAAGIAKGLGTQTNLVDLIQRDLLGDASPEATRQFRTMVASLMAGRLSVADLKKQAKSVSDQAHKMKAEVGEEAGVALDSYLAILDNFLADRPLMVEGQTPLVK